MRIRLRKPALAGVALGAVVLGTYLLAHAAALFDTNAAPIGYVGMPAITSNDISSGNEYLYVGDYNVQAWSGNLHKYRVLSSGRILVNADGSTDQWTGGAAAAINAQPWDTGTDARKIATMNGTSKVAFRWANLSAAQQTAIGDQATLNYLRGDRSGESTGTFRTRDSVLGDIIHSSPVYWEDPPQVAANGTTTASTNCSNAPCKTVFVGGNDGMLHVIDAGTGKERFAYLPAQFLGGSANALATLADTGYAHNYYVDGQIAVGTFSNQSILVAALGGGGQGLFAIDVTNPNPSSEANAASKTLWEISDNSSGFSNLGNIYGSLSFTLAADRTPLLVTGNGFNNQSSYAASMFLINAKTGALVSEISTGNGSSTNPNGLASATVVDVDADGAGDYAYAGDLAGNLWRFDLKNKTAYKLYTTINSQAITMAPAVEKHPLGGYMVVFATGKLYDSTDQKDASTHYAYGIRDTYPSSGANNANTTLVTQTLTETTSNGTRLRTVTNNAIDWTTALGWKVALPIGGERLVGSGGARISKKAGSSSAASGSGTGSGDEMWPYVFQTSNPTINPTATWPSENWWMQLYYLTGGGTLKPQWDLDGNGVVDSADRLSNGDYPVGYYTGPGIQSQRLTVLLAGQTRTFVSWDRNGNPPSPSVKGVANGHFDVEFYKAPNTICTGQSNPSAGAIGQGSVTFNYGTDKYATKITIKVGSETVYSGTLTSKSNKKGYKPSALVSFLDGQSSANYTLVADSSNSSKILVVANSTGSTYNGAVTVTLTTNGSTPGYTAVNVTGGVSPSGTGSLVSDSDTKCDKTGHTHEYDDAYDRTGVNMLNPSVSSYKLSQAISGTKSFKVLVMNQYLNPAAMIHIGRNDYNPASANGYIQIKDFQTSGTLTLSSLPSYTLSTVGSLAVNLPTDAFTVRDWWGNGDSRAGLLASSPQCVYYGQVGSGGSLTANILADMYTPVVPPVDGANGAGTLASTTTRSQAVRHNGALTVQIIDAATPQTAIEQNVAGNSKYGYRVKSEYFYSYVLAEYTLFWHHPRRVCFHDSTTTWYNGSSGGNGYPTASSGAWNTTAKMTGRGWTKDAPEDTVDAGASKTPATGSTDPKLGTFASIAEVIGGDGSGSSNTDAFNDVAVTGVVKCTSASCSQGDVTSLDGVVSSGGSAGGSATGVTPGAAASPTGLLQRGGRINWKEIVK